MHRPALRDVRRVGRRNTGEMVQGALTLREMWPPAPPVTGVDLDTVDALLTSLMGQPLVTIHPEHDDPDVCFIGAPVDLANGKLRLLEVTPRAVWTKRPTKHRMDDITRVDIGGRYEQALLGVAGSARGK